MYPHHYQQSTPMMAAYPGMGGISPHFPSGMSSYQFGDHCRNDGSNPRKEMNKDGKKNNQNHLKSLKENEAYNSKIAENQLLKRKIVQYEGQIAKLQNNDFTKELKRLSVGCYLPNVRRRDSILSHVSDDAPLMKAIEVLMPGAFNKASRSVLTAAKNVCTNAEKATSGNDLNIIAEDITKFNKGMTDMKIEENVTVLETLRNQVNLNILEIEKSVKFEKTIKPQQRQFTSKLDSFQSTLKQFRTWKNMYVSSIKHADDGVDKVIESLDNTTSFLKSVRAGKSEKFMELQLLDLKNALKACNVEGSLGKQEPIIYCTLVKVRHELNQRLSTIREVKQVHTVINNLGVLHPPAVTLLELVTKSEDNLKPKVAFHYMQGVMDDIIALHDAGEVYVHVNPENIMISDNGSLVKRKKAKACEPVFPFICMAPELKANKEKPVVSITGEGPEPVKPTIAADVYSFGQVVLWLACLNTSKSSQEIWTVMQEKMKVLSDLLASEPTLRPSTSEIKVSLPQLFEKLFGESVEEEQDVVVEEDEELKEEDLGKEQNGTDKASNAGSEEDEATEESDEEDEQEDKKEKSVPEKK